LLGGLAHLEFIRNYSIIQFNRLRYSYLAFSKISLSNYRNYDNPNSLICSKTCIKNQIIQYIDNIWDINYPGAPIILKQGDLVKFDTIHFSPYQIISTKQGELLSGNFLVVAVRVPEDHFIFNFTTVTVDEILELLNQSQDNKKIEIDFMGCAFKELKSGSTCGMRISGSDISMHFSSDSVEEEIKVNEKNMEESKKSFNESLKKIKLEIVKNVIYTLSRNEIAYDDSFLELYENNIIDFVKAFS